MCSDRVDSVVIGKAAQRRTPLHMRSLRGGTLKARSPNRATPHRGALALDESEFGIFSGDWLSGPRSDTAHGLEPRRRWAAMNAVSGRVRETEIVPQSTALSRSWSFSGVGKQGQTGKRPRKRGSLSSDRSLFRISDCTSSYPIAPAASRRDKSTEPLQQDAAGVNPDRVGLARNAGGIAGSPVAAVRRCRQVRLAAWSASTFKSYTVSVWRA